MFLSGNSKFKHVKRKRVVKRITNTNLNAFGDDPQHNFGVEGGEIQIVEAAARV